MDQWFQAGRECKPSETMQEVEQGLEFRVLRRLRNETSRHEEVEVSYVDFLLPRALVMAAGVCVLVIALTAPGLPQLDDLWIKTWEMDGALSIMIQSVGFI